MKPRQQPLQVIPAPNRIAVHAANPGAGKDLCQPLLALFRARTKIVKVLALALWAARRHRALKPAIMALQPLSRACDSCILRGRLMVRERDRAVLAFEFFPACPADHSKRVTPPVQ